MSRIVALYSFSIGIFSIGFSPWLPSSFCLFVLFFLVLSLFFLRCYVLAWLLLGICYGVSWGQYALSHQLPDSLSPSEFLLTGQVTGLPSIDDNRVRFNFRILPTADNHNHNGEAFGAFKTVRLNWYYNPVEIIPGQVWRLKVKLKRPRGMVNPGGFDYQAWLIRQGVSATGYVRKEGSNHLLTTLNSFDAERFRLQKAIQKSPNSDDAKSLVVALTLGDRALVSDELWDTLAHSGVVHLMVISGLHVGLVAMFSFGVGAGFARVGALLGLPVTVRYWGGICSLLAAAAYAGVAGFNLPAQRALIMILVVIFAVLLDRKVSRSLGFGLALAGVALLDPLACLSAGFWLSFGAVACLLWLVPVAVKASPWTRFIRVQWLVFIALLMPLILCQLPIAWLSPLVNMVAIPWVSLFIVPLCLIATVVFPLNPEWAVEIWSLACWQLDYFVLFIQAFSEPPHTTIFPLTILKTILELDLLPRYLPLPMSFNVSLVLVLISCLLLLPRGFPGKYLLIPLTVGLVFMPFNQGPPLKVTVLDVGQGLSIVVQTYGGAGRHTLVYDTGPGHHSGFNTGKSVVAPYLRYKGITQVDMLVLSHSDNDHAGGAESLFELFPATQVFWGEKIKLDKPTQWANKDVSFCRAGESWSWDGVVFKFLHPSEKAEKNNNNRSCVLQIQYRDQTIILPGDIESEVERRLEETIQLEQPIALLVAPHHGSRTSSTSGFVKKLKPQHVVFSAGYKHHFGHPAPAVMSRYQHQGSRLWNTADHGAIEFSWDERGYLRAIDTRINKKRYWY